jgi:hypothetical protein
MEMEMDTPIFMPTTHMEKSMETKARTRYSLVLMSVFCLFLQAKSFIHRGCSIHLPMLATEHEKPVTNATLWYFVCPSNRVKYNCLGRRRIMRG